MAFQKPLFLSRSEVLKLFLVYPLEEARTILNFSMSHHPQTDVTN